MEKKVNVLNLTLPTRAFAILLLLFGILFSLFFTFKSQQQYCCNMYTSRIWIYLAILDIYQLDNNSIGLFYFCFWGLSYFHFILDIKYMGTGKCHFKTYWKLENFGTLYCCIWFHDARHLDVVVKVLWN